MDVDCMKTLHNKIISTNKIKSQIKELFYGPFQRKVEDNIPLMVFVPTNFPLKDINAT